MTNKRIRLPKTDVEGHGWTNPAPPVDFSPRTPTHGGELTPNGTDDEPGANQAR